MAMTCVGRGEAHERRAETAERGLMTEASAFVKQEAG